LLAASPTRSISAEWQIRRSYARLIEVKCFGAEPGGSIALPLAAR
jgi:hypothetical protein